MRNLKRLSEAELVKRAKELYFDHNKKIEKIFVDEYGRFSYEKQSLIEQNSKEVGVFEIDRKGLEVPKPKQEAPKEAPKKEAK